MRKGSSRTEEEMRPEYDLSKLTGKVRGKYHKRVMQSGNVVRLDPDVAEVFPNEKSVNDALRLLVRLARRSPRRTARARVRKV